MQNLQMFRLTVFGWLKSRRCNYIGSEAFVIVSEALRRSSVPIIIAPAAFIKPSEALITGSKPLQIALETNKEVVRENADSCILKNKEHQRKMKAYS